MSSTLGGGTKGPRAAGSFVTRQRTNARQAGEQAMIHVKFSSPPRFAVKGIQLSDVNTGIWQRRGFASKDSMSQVP